MLDSHACSLLTLKSFDEQRRTFRGIASTVQPDRMEDVVEPRGAEFALPLPFLHQHDAKRPIGKITAARVTDHGIEVDGFVENVAEPPALKERLDVAWAEMKSGLVAGLSIGFRGKEYERIKDSTGLRFKRWEWLELSLVTIPANSQASIHAIKSIDQRARATSGTPAPLAKPRPGASGDPPPRSRTMKSFQEQIAEFGETRQEKQARLTEILTAIDNDLTKLGDDADEYDALGAELKTIDKQIERANAALMASGKATPITPDVGTNPERATRVRAGDFHMKSNLPPGTMFARAVHAKVYGAKNFLTMRDLAALTAKTWPDTPQVGQYLLQKANPGTGLSGNWAEPLNTVTTVEGEFIAELRPATIVGRLGLRPAPFNTRMIVQGPASSSANWVGNAAAKPVGEGVYDTVEIGQHKIAEIIVLTEDQIMSSHIDSVEATRQDLIARISQFADEQFTSTTAATANNPAGMLAGVDDVASGGSTAEDLLHDINALMNRFIAHNIPLSNVTLIVSSFVAFGIAGLRNPFNVPIFPGVSINGGTIDGMRIIVSNNVGGTSTGSNIIAVVPSLILLADGGGIRVDMSREATIDMAGGNSPTYSLYQKNSVGLRCEWFVSWAKAHSAAVQYISGASYAPAAPA